ncbi:MAG: TonB-dependent receptor [Proteobacteria bacterium]|nr:TonB-dependent receptor [Pseudomonadota bacterium]
MLRKIFCLILLFMGFNGLSNAENVTSYKLGEIVVTESKIEQSEQYVTQKIDVVTEEEINVIPIKNRNLSEIIETQPGSFVNPLSRNDANWGSFGGLGPKYNVFLLDGVPIDNMVDPMSLSVNGLERVEVFRGPASIHYQNYLSADFAGFQSPLAGVTNFVLKEKIDKSATKILAGYGTWDTNFYSIYHQGKVSDFNYFLGGDFEQSNYTNYGTNPSWLNMIDDPEYKKTKLYGKVTYFIKPDKESLSIFAHHTQHTGDAGRPNRDFDHNYDVVNFGYTNEWSDNVNIALKGGYRNYHRRWGEDNYPANLQLREHDGVRQKIFPIDLNVNIRHMKNSLFTTGVDYQFATYDTYAEVNGFKSLGNDAQSQAVGVYVQEKLVMDNFVLRAGLRYANIDNEFDLLSGNIPDIREKSWQRLIYSVGIRYNLNNNFSFFANSGNSFIPPSAKQVGGTLKATDIFVPGKNGQLPNPGLKPEKGTSYDVGVEGYFKNFYTALRLYYTRLKETIVENVVSTTPSQTRSENAGKTKSYGLEFEIKNEITPNLWWFANATLTETDVDNPFDINQNNSDIPFVPKYMANLGVFAKLPYGFTIYPYATFVGKYYDSTNKSGRRDFGPYEYLNLKLIKELVSKKDYKIELNFDINNIFDRKFEMPWQFQDPGFNMNGSLVLKF